MKLSATLKALAKYLLPPATGVRQGFRDVYVALAERHSHAGECASCKEGWDGGDLCYEETPILTFPRFQGGRNQFADVFALVD